MHGRKNSNHSNPLYSPLKSNNRTTMSVTNDTTNHAHYPTALQNQIIQSHESQLQFNKDLNS